MDFLKHLPSPISPTFSEALIGLLACAGCDGKGSAQGGGTENGSHGHVKIGIPF